MRSRLLPALVLAACSEPAIVITGPHHQYAVTVEQITAISTSKYGVDLNGDGVVDDQLGEILGAMQNMGITDPQQATDQALAGGLLQMTIDVQAPDDTLENTDAAFTVFAGAPGVVPDPGSALVTHIGTDHAVAGPGTATLVAAPFGTPIDLELAGAGLDLELSGDQLVGALGGGLGADAVRQVFATWQATLGPILAHDCTATTDPPMCTCTSGSVGGDIISYFDSDHDCMITLDEITGSDLYRNLTANDVTIDHVPRLSIGVGITAVYSTTLP